jgi:pyridoxal phosphate enzyme (YggS family)
MSTFVDRWNNLQKSIEEAVFPRLRQKVTIIAVSKKQSFESIEEAYESGVRHFGENYVQEMLPKIETAEGKKMGIHWHYIGSIQSNKLNKLVPNVSYLHAVDQLSHIEKLDKMAQEAMMLPKIFVQLNLADESTKSGILESEIPHFFEKVSQCLHVEISGLMTFPPMQTDPEKNRVYFAKMQEWKERINGWKLNRIEIQDLSMGVSSDFKVAVEEGATMVRLGEVLFGPRA